MKCAEQQHLETLNVQATVDFRLDIFSAVVHLIWWAVHIACAFTLVDEITFRFSITIIAGLLSQVYTIAAPVTESYSCNFQHGSCARIAANFAVFLILFGLLPVRHPDRLTPFTFTYRRMLLDLRFYRSYGLWHCGIRVSMKCLDRTSSNRFR